QVKGIIYPPPDIRAIVDKTARFVAKNGKSFEDRIQSSEEGKSAKFNFMRPHDPYYAYYEFKIRDFEENGDAPKETATPAPEKSEAENGSTEGGSEEQPEGEGGGDQKGDKKTGPSSLSRKAVMAPIAKAALSLNKDQAPPPFEFSVGHPMGLTALDVDIIKLTAQFTAVGGRNFLSELARREAKNEQFQFLKHTHALFSYFTSLVDAYTKVLQPTAAQKAMVDGGRGRQYMLQKCVHRWEHQREQSAKKEASLAAEDADRVAFRSIDWHDFVVVETIEFPDDELVEPLEGLDIQDVEEVEEEEPQEAEEPVPPPPPEEPLDKSEEDEDEDMDMDMDMDLEDDDEDEGGMPPPPPPGPPPPPQHDDDEDINVVSNYKPDVSMGGSSQIPNMVVDPISGKAMAASELSDHLRIQLLDPKWREEQERAAAKHKETAYAEGQSIAASLKSLARNRGDIFGSAEASIEEEAQMREESERKRRRLEETNRIRWDGNIATANAVRQAALEKQLAMPRSALLPTPAGPQIGPSIPGMGAKPPLPPGAPPPLPHGPPPPPPPP
ncbi:unnamed protein product, partial [Choristocarpus tenellus]